MEPGKLLALAWLAAMVLAALLLVHYDLRRTGQSFPIYVGFRALWLFCKLWHGVRPRGMDPVPLAGPAIVISNHTSPVDPLFLQCASRRIITFLMAREYFDVAWLRPIFQLSRPIPVNRTGRDTAAMKATLRALGEGRVIGIFPEGGIHLDPSSLGAARPGTALLALLTRAPVIPAFIDRPIHTNKILTAVVRQAHARVYFGPAIDLQPYFERAHDAATIEEVTRCMMNSIERLRPSRKRIVAG